MRRTRPGRLRPAAPFPQAPSRADVPARGATVPAVPSADGLMPQALGLETKGGVFTALIARGAKLPARRSDIFTTADDSQTSITITVLQRQDRRATHSTRLGVFELTGIAPQPRGLPQIEVTFAVDSAALTLSAIDLLTGEELPVTVSGDSPPGPVW